MAQIGMEGMNSGNDAGMQGSMENPGLKEKAVSEVSSMVDRAKNTAQDRVVSSANTGKATAVRAFTGVAQSLRRAGEDLQNEQNGAANFVTQTADRLESMAQNLEHAQVNELVQRTENWARQNPALFIAGAFGLGILGARFLKSSGSNEQGTSPRGYAGAQFTDREVARSVLSGEEL